jgi:hypothetical protein
LNKLKKERSKKAKRADRRYLNGGEKSKVVEQDLSAKERAGEKKKTSQKAKH